MSTELSPTVDSSLSFARPKKYKVILLNDDSTPMEFVIEILVGVFNKTPAEAEKITMQVHNEGKGVAGIYFYETAEQKVFEATNISRANGFPLSLNMEEE